MSTIPETTNQELDCTAEPERDYSTATKFDVDMMITVRLMQFHRALVARDQINPVPPAAGPKVAET